MRSHVSHLAGVADQLESAASGAAGAGAPPSAFGLIGGFVPAMLQPLVDQAQRVLAAGRESVSVTGRLMGQAVDAYAHNDSAGAAVLREQERAL